MDYIDCLNHILQPDPNPKYLAVDLFSGCGGLSLGFEACGFETIGYEKSIDACETYNFNLLGTCFNETISCNKVFPKAEAVIAGPPCQPFSVNGNQLGTADSRNGFPICISAIEQISPKIFVLENVRGLLYKNKWYLNSICEQLEYLGYKINVCLLNARHYLVPQNRERVFIIGSKKKKISIPPPQRFEITAGEALGCLPYQYDENSKFLTAEMDMYIEKYEVASKCIVSRNLHLDKPCRTLTCRNLGGSTGDMLRVELPNGQRRKLTIRESARLQSFPDWFQFMGREVNIFKQIGNAVPPMMAYEVAQTVRKYLDSE